MGPVVNSVRKQSTSPLASGAGLPCVVTTLILEASRSFRRTMASRTGWLIVASPKRAPLSRSFGSRTGSSARDVMQKACLWFLAPRIVYSAPFAVARAA